MADSVADLERQYLGAALGYSGATLVAKSLDDLRYEFYTNPPAAVESYPALSDYQFKAQSVSPFYLGSVASSVGSSGRQQFTRIKVKDAGTITNINFGVRAAGTVFTAGNEVGLYSVSGSTATLLSKSGDLSTVMNTTGFKTVPLAVPQEATKGQILYVVLLNNATSLPTVGSVSGEGLTGIILNHGTASTRPAYSDTTVRTALLASYTLSTLTASADIPWYGLT